jgi:very-short-patch-repair endonuclease
MVGRLPRALSSGEETFSFHCKAHNLSPAREYRFHPTRRWKFDFCFPEARLAVEVEGGTRYGKSRHSQGAGFEADCNKYNQAARMGWVVLRYSTAMVLRGDAINEVLEILGGLDHETIPTQPQT